MSIPLTDHAEARTGPFLASDLAPEIAAAYCERWEIEITFDELETRQRGPAAVLRSRSPDLALQELYGLLITRYAIRQLMTEAAVVSGDHESRARAGTRRRRARAA